jgi:hypothetical protein
MKRDLNKNKSKKIQVILKKSLENLHYEHLLIIFVLNICSLFKIKCLPDQNATDGSVIRLF